MRSNPGRSSGWGLGRVLAGLSLAATASAGDPVPDFQSNRPVDFNRDVRPILAENCLVCHGPDAADRKTELRFDDAKSPFRDLGGYSAIVPGDPSRSHMLDRLLSADSPMPPPEAGKKLATQQIELLRRWIEQGAKWQDHWAYSAPVRPPIPNQLAFHVRNEIDAFLGAKLDAEGLHASREADPASLLRRVHLDLTGLPPTAADLDLFLAERATDPEAAYERAVDGLLGSVRHAEWMAKDWLDVARYGDTHGYHLDNYRSIWRYRDWVIDAFRRNMPFDRFTLEQIAGDLLPDATLESRIATGFLRCNPTTAEGGLIEEEYLVKYAVDRAETVATVWLGSTFGCAQCHDHKYDPLTQREFYSFYGFFNNLAERGTDENIEIPPPVIPAPTEDQAAQLAALDTKLRAIEAKLDVPRLELSPALAKFEAEWRANWDSAFETCRPSKLVARDGVAIQSLPDGSIEVTGTNPANDDYVMEFATERSSIEAIRLEVLRSEHSNGRIGRAHNGNFVLTHVKFEAAPLVGEYVVIPLRHASADFSQPNFAIGNAIDGDGNSGWASDTRTNEDRLAFFAADQSFGFPGGTRVRITFEFHSQFSEHAFARFRVATSADPRHAELARSLSDGALARGVLALQRPTDLRTEDDRSAITRLALRTLDPGYLALDDQRIALQAERAEVTRQIPLTLVAAEATPRRPAHFLIRGQYDRKGDEVTTGVPAIFPPLPRTDGGAPANRLALARWLVDPNHPLTARVTVNRLWQRIFGTGLVETAEDFGLRGTPPSHPELLDWLAVEFVESGYDMRRMLKAFVMSTAYRQSSAVTPKLLERDPKNRYLARGTRRRLDAEALRDQALFVSGLLVERVGGPSVRPYQPDGIWQAVAYPTSNTARYQQDHGDALYRRSLYTFWKRTAPPPALAALDAPSRESCVVRRSLTNTPLQALALMNDIQFVEAARFLGERILREGGATVEERLRHGFRLATSRWPETGELAALRAVFEAQREHYAADPAAAAALLAVGEKPRDPSMDAIELAAMTIVGNVLLNLDETLTKG